MLHIQLKYLGSMSESIPAYPPRTQILESHCVFAVFLNGVQALTHGYAFHFAAHQVKSIPSMHVLRSATAPLRLNACRWRARLFGHVLAIGLLVFTFIRIGPASDVNVSMWLMLNWWESTSWSCWILTCVCAWGLLKTSITDVVWNVIFSNEIVLDLKIRLKL